MKALGIPSHRSLPPRTPLPQPRQHTLWLRPAPVATSGHGWSVSSEWRHDFLTKIPFLSAATQCEESPNVCLLYQRLHYISVILPIQQTSDDPQWADCPHEQAGLLGGAGYSSDRRPRPRQAGQAPCPFTLCLRHPL